MDKDLKENNMQELLVSIIVDFKRAKLVGKGDELKYIYFEDEKDTTCLVPFYQILASEYERLKMLGVEEVEWINEEEGTI